MDLSRQEKEKVLLAAEELTAMAAAVTARLDEEAETREIERKTKEALYEEAERGWIRADAIRPTDGQVVAMVCADGWMQMRQYSTKGNRKWYAAGRPVLYWHPVPSVRNLPGVTRNAWKLAEDDAAGQEKEGG